MRDSRVLCSLEENATVRSSFGARHLWCEPYHGAGKVCAVLTPKELEWLREDVSF